MGQVEYEFDFDAEEKKRGFTFLDLDSSLNVKKPRPRAQEWDPTKPGTRFGDYEVVSVLDWGAAGLVLRGRHLRSKAPVAIKILHEELDQKASLRERFRREAVAVSRVRHENIIDVLVYGIVNNRPFMVLEFLEGGSVAQLLDRQKKEKKRLGVDRVVDLARETLAGLEAAHGQDLLHRDIKPANLLLDGSGRVKIADFGLVKMLVDVPDMVITAPGAAVGTPLYMAPEQCAGGLVDARSDLYSVGVTLFELLTNRLPFQGAKTPVSHYKLQLESPAPFASSIHGKVPRKLDAFVAKLLEFQATDRFASAREAREALKKVLPPPARISLEIETEEGPRSFVLDRGKKLVLGRSKDAGLSIPGSGLSRFHCQLELRSKGPVVTDLESTNGTYLNGRKLTGPTALPRKAKIRLGKRETITIRWRRATGR